MGDAASVRVHDVPGLLKTPLPSLLNVMLPEGALAAPLASVSVTVAVQVVGLLTGIGEMQLTEVEVDRAVAVTVAGEVDALPAWVLSPA